VALPVFVFFFFFFFDDMYILCILDEIYVFFYIKLGNRFIPQASPMLFLTTISIPLLILPFLLLLHHP